MLRAAAGKPSAATVQAIAPCDAQPRAAAANRLFGPSLVTSRPNPHFISDDARALRASDLTPDLSPGYAPRGTPPDGYKIALAARKVNE